MTWEEFERNLNTVNDLKMELKRRSSYFQVELKEDAAKWWNLPLDTFYEYSYDDWQHVHSRMNAEIDCMTVHREAFEEYTGLLVRTKPFYQWINLFRAWAALHNLTLPRYDDPKEDE